jgi:hypothetical protein
MRYEAMRASPGGRCVAAGKSPRSRSGHAYEAARTGNSSASLLPSSPCGTATG